MDKKNINKKESFNKNILNKIENRIKFNIETGYYLDLLNPKTIRLLGSTKSKIKKMETVKMCLI